MNKNSDELLLVQKEKNIPELPQFSIQGDCLCFYEGKRRITSFPLKNRKQNLYFLLELIKNRDDNPGKNTILHIDSKVTIYVELSKIDFKINNNLISVFDIELLYKKLVKYLNDNKFKESRVFYEKNRDINSKDLSGDELCASFIFSLILSSIYMLSVFIPFIIILFFVLFVIYCLL